MDLQSKGVPVTALDLKPDLYDWMHEYIVAFDMLSSRRSSGFAPNPISMQDINAYLNIFGATDIEKFIRHIIIMDCAFLNYIAKIQNNKDK